MHEKTPAYFSENISMFFLNISMFFACLPND